MCAPSHDDEPPDIAGDSRTRDEWQDPALLLLDARYAGVCWHVSRRRLGSRILRFAAAN
jgi:hypothetical protein